MLKTVKYGLYFKRCTSKWYPDAEWFSQFDGPVMYKDDMTSKWKTPWNGKEDRLKMRKFKNIEINFGPVHPAAHGVLRMVMELEGEVSVVFLFLFLGARLRLFSDD